MSSVAVHGPNTMFTSEGGGTPVQSSPVGATATKSPTNGLSFAFAFPNPGARPAADFDWTFTGPGAPAAQPDKYSGTVLYTGAGAGTIICTVAAGAGPPAAGAYTITVAATAGTPRSVEQSVEGDGDEGDYDPSDHTVAEVEEHANTLETVDQVQALIEKERAGKDRSTLIAFLESMIPYDPGEHTVADVVQYATDNPDEVTDIIASEREGKNRTTLLSQLEALQTT